MKQTQSLALVAASLCLLFSCENKLNRDDAKAAIIEHYGYPIVEVERIVGAGYSVFHLQPANSGPNLFGGIQIGQSSDLFFYERDYNGNNVLTEKGLRYLAPPEACDACIEQLPNISWKNRNFYCVATNIWEFKEITGMTQAESDKKATVEYVLIAKEVNTFGHYNNITDGMEKTLTTTLTKFDDGSWRVEGGKPNYILKPSDIPAYAQSSK